MSQININVLKPQDPNEIRVINTLNESPHIGNSTNIISDLESLVKKWEYLVRGLSPTDPQISAINACKADLDLLILQFKLFNC